MGSEIFIAGSGCLNRARSLELTANNLANANTIGFKRDIPSFSSFFYPWVVPSTVPHGFSVPILDSARTDFSQGMMKETGNPFDFAVEGDGFFAVMTPSGIRYTRNGSFRLSAERTLTTQEGYQVLGENGPLRVTGDGIKSDSKGNIFSDGTKIGRIRIVEFSDLSSLEKVGDALYKPAGEGNPTQAAAGKTTVNQGMLELSNVNVIVEMTGMIETLRAYESKMKAIQTLDEVSRRTVVEVGRL